MDRGGLTKAILARANILSSEYEKINFLTVSFQRNLQKVVEDAKSTNQVSNNIKVYNIFEDLYFSEISQSTHSDSIAEESLLEEKGYEIIASQKSKFKSYRYFKNGIYKKYKRYHLDGYLEYVDYFDDAKNKIRHDEFNTDNKLVLSRSYDAFENPKVERFFNSEGVCVLSIWINDDGDLGRCFTFTDNKSYNSFKDLQIAWFENKLKELNLKNVTITVDQRHLDPIVINLNSNFFEAKKIAITHNIHLEKPFDNPKNITKSYKRFYENLDKFDELVFLTQKQRDDVYSLYGSISKYNVIPHSVPYNHKAKENNHDQLLAITIARLVPQKRVDQAIRAFRFVVDKIPAAKYEIYGVGVEEKKLKTLVEELKLTNNVIFKGYTKNAMEQYSKASLSILTSDYEGFGLVLTESLSVGTPVVAFDIKYGPSDIIRDGIDGYLIEKNDLAAMAEKIINIMNDENHRMFLSENAIKVNDRFSVERFKDNWLSIL